LFTAGWLSEFRFLSGDLIRLSADAQNGESSGDKNADNAKGNQNYKHLVSDRAYLVGDVAELYDSVADISYRITPSLGIGYFLIKESKTSLSVDIGPGYQWEKIGGIEDDYAIFRAGERFEHTFESGAKVWQAADYTPKVEDTDIYTVNAEVGAEAAMTKSISLRVVFSDQYINIPAAGRERNDTKLIGGVSVKL
jgi:putative salt-induced outer membrane protein YdiY